MPNILQFVGFAVGVSLILLLLKGFAPEYVVPIRIIAVIMICMPIYSQIKIFLDMIVDLYRKISTDDTYIFIILKIVGISYLVEFGVSIMKDAGESSLAKSLEFAGKIMILVLATPIIKALIDLINGLI